MALCGVSGSGKSYSALLLARGLGGKTALIDTEAGSAQLYSHLADFDVMVLEAPYHPERYILAIKEAERAGYDNLIIDSLSHAWSGSGGMLAAVDKHNESVANSGWRKMSPKHNALVEAILTSKMNIIVTMRDKTEYSYEKNEEGKIVPKKIGLAPIQKGDSEYDYSIVLDIDRSHLASVSKNRTSLWQDEIPFVITEQTGKDIMAWLVEGKDPEPRKPLCGRCLVSGKVIEAVEGDTTGCKFENLCGECMKEWEAKKSNQPEKA